MSEPSWDDEETTKKTEQEPTTQLTGRLGIGRAKAKPNTNNDEPPPPAVSQWNNGGNTSGSFKSFRNNDNDENNNHSSNGGFGARNGGGNGFARGGRGGGGNRGGFGSNNDGDSRACYNCNQTGHMSRDCPEPKKDNRGGRGGGYNAGGGRGGYNSGGNRGGFNSGNDGGDRNVNFGSRSNGGSESMSVTFRPTRNQNDDDQDNNGDRKPGFGGFRGGRGGVGGGAGFSSGNRDNRANGNGSNWQNGSGEQSRDFGGDRKPRDGDGHGGGFSSGGGRRNDRVSDDVFDQPGGRGGAHPIERYVPPPAPTNEDDIFGKAVAKGENFGKYHRTQVQCTPPDKVKSIDLYEEANLSTQVLSNIRSAHFEEPTPIQRYTIPCIRQQDDIMACAQTGSGKTAAFLLPIISNLLEYHADELTEQNNPPAPLCLILSPTRELALQTEREARKFSYKTNVIPCSAIGGHDMFAVTDRLREGCHILSATTGRLKDMVEKGRISLKKVKYFVLDEADRMLDTGFEPDIRKLQELGLPSKEERFTSMFSATFPDEVQKLAKHFLRDNYVFLVVGTPGGANEDIAQTIEEVPQSNKKERLFQLLEQNLKSERCLIFVETKRSADYIGSLLSQKQLMSTTMHGDRTQRQRNEAVQQFTNGSCPILVATSVAARGLDFPLIGYVVNYDLPDSSDFYIHRIGRTGRAGHLGKSISFFDPERESDRRIAPDLVAKLTEAGQDVPPFLTRFTEGGSTGFSRGGGPGGRNADMRSGANNFGSRNFQQAAPSGGSASAGTAQATEEWD